MLKDETNSSSIKSQILRRIKEMLSAISSLPLITKPSELDSTKRRRSISQSDEHFNCNICGKTFSNGQALGGHMSRRHRNESSKYQAKQVIFKSRESIRKDLIETKRTLCLMFNLDYDRECLSSEGKEKVKSLIKENKEIFRKIRKEFNNSSQT